MSTLMDEGIKRWTARRKTALVLAIIHQGKTSVAKANHPRSALSEVESWIEEDF